MENYFKQQSGGALSSYWIGLSQPWAVTPGTGAWCAPLLGSRAARCLRAMMALLAPRRDPSDIRSCLP